jgi:NADPH2:quinone reductase
VEEQGIAGNAFTDPEDLQIAEIEEPKPASDQVLIDVHAASVSFMAVSPAARLRRCQ